MYAAQNLTASNVLKHAFNSLDRSFARYISSRKRRYSRDNGIFHFHRNLSAAVRRQLDDFRSADSENKIMVECDKNMGDLFIKKKVVDENALKILSDKCFVRHHLTSRYISFSVRETTWNLTRKYLFHFRNEWSRDRDYRRWLSTYWKSKRSGEPLKVPNLRPLRKLHKPGNSWRRVINASNWWSSFLSIWLGRECLMMLDVLQHITGRMSILQNSFELITIYRRLNTDCPSTLKTRRIFADFDVKALYDVLDLDQSTKIILWLNDKYLHWDRIRIRFMVDIIRYFRDNSWVSYDDQNFKVITGIGTGYSHSKDISDLTLFGFELLNHHRIYSKFQPISNLSFVTIRLFKRYVDDIKIVIDIDIDGIDPEYVDSHCSWQVDMVEALIRDLYPKNIELTSQHGASAVYMDTESHIDPITNHITTTIYEKPLSKHINLHYTSNNTLDHKRSIFQSQLFRAITLCDQPYKYRAFKRNFLCRIQSRGYNPFFIRNLKDRIPIYQQRDRYLSSIDRTRNIRFLRSILAANQHIGINKQYLSESELYDITLLIREIDAENEDSRTIFFIKTFQSLFDSEDELRTILSKFSNDHLPSYFRDKIKISLCNKTDSKLRAFLH